MPAEYMPLLHRTKPFQTGDTAFDVCDPWDLWGPCALPSTLDCSLRKKRHHPFMSTSPQPKPMGWLVGLAVVLITFGVLCGLIGITVAAKRKQRYRITDDAPVRSTNTLPPASAR